LSCHCAIPLFLWYISYFQSFSNQSGRKKYKLWLKCIVYHIEKFKSTKILKEYPRKLCKSSLNEIFQISSICITVPIKIFYCLGFSKASAKNCKKKYQHTKSINQSILVQNYRIKMCHVSATLKNYYKLLQNNVRTLVLYSRGRELKSSDSHIIFFFKHKMCFSATCKNFKFLNFEHRLKIWF
jgi:hypothetical protein